jgi:hypothetical protein
MGTKRYRRLQKQGEAMRALKSRSGPVLSLLGEVISDLSEEVEGLHTFEQDAAFAAELAWRIDKKIQLKDPILEALDGVVIFFVALAAVGIWRAAARRDHLRNAKIDRIRERLRKNGPKMADAMEKRLNRRLRRLLRRQRRAAQS